MPSVLKTAAAIAALVLFGNAAMADGRAPTAEERTSVENALKGHGFKNWGKIEFDDGKWEVDDAHHEDGKLYDLDLKKDDFSILKKELEN